MRSSIDGTTSAVRNVGSDVGGSLGGYFDKLGSQISSLSYSVPANSGYAQGGAASSFKFSGLGSSSSWGGRRLSFSTGTPDPSRMGAALRTNFMDRLNYGWHPPQDTASDATNTTATPVLQVVVNVPPITTEGGRLSTQSRAEVKQLAAVGANAALRAYNGR